MPKGIGYTPEERAYHRAVRMFPVDLSRGGLTEATERVIGVPPKERVPPQPPDEEMLSRRDRLMDLRRLLDRAEKLKLLRRQAAQPVQQRFTPGPRQEAVITPEQSAALRRLGYDMPASSPEELREFERTPPHITMPRDVVSRPHMDMPPDVIGEPPMGDEESMILELLKRGRSLGR